MGKIGIFKEFLVKFIHLRNLPGGIPDYFSKTALTKKPDIRCNSYKCRVFQV